tara:strand:- start:4912 stop:5976 length:1065 start_codon:yes stop_codon:yes gene_type:complete
MGKSSSPDYEGAAVAQGDANEGVVRSQTYANRPTQTTPWGSVQWTPGQTTDPSSGEQVTTWEQNEQLTPELQGILDQQIGVQGQRTDIASNLMGRVGDEFGQKVDWSGLDPMGGYVDPQLTTGENVQNSVNFTDAPAIGDPNQTRQAAEDAVYNQAMSRIQPEYEAGRQQKEIALRNRGLGPEDEAYKAEMLGLDNRFTDSRNQALWSANDAGRDEAAQMFGQDVTNRGVSTGETLAQGNFANNASETNYGQALRANAQNYGQAMGSSNQATAIRQQQMTEEMQQRGYSLNEINALLSGQQVSSPQMPSFVAAGSAQPAPVYQGAVDQGNFNQANSQQGIDAITGLASAGMGFL